MRHLPERVGSTPGSLPPVAIGKPICKYFARGRPLAGGPGRRFRRKAPYRPLRGNSCFVATIAPRTSFGSPAFQIPFTPHPPALLTAGLLTAHFYPILQNFFN